MYMAFIIWLHNVILQELKHVAYMIVFASLPRVKQKACQSYTVLNVLPSITASIAAANAVKLSSSFPYCNMLWGNVISLLHVCAVMVLYSSLQNEITILYGFVDSVM